MRRSSARSRGYAALAALVFAAGLVRAVVPATAEPTGVATDRETTPVTHSGDAADDPAIWIDPVDPSRSVVIGNDKAGALDVYDLAGARLQHITGGFFGNVDVRTGFPLGAGSMDIAAVTHNGLTVYAIDPTTRLLSDVTQVGGIPAASGSEGLCLYHSRSGRFYVFQITRAGRVQQFELGDANADGLVDDTLVRSWDLGSESEGCVADDETGAFYVSHEDVALWRYGAEPTDDVSARTSIDTVGGVGHLVSDIEGLTIVDQGGGTGYLIASAQNVADPANSYFAVYQREQPQAFLGTFRIAAGPNADGCSRTDGVAATGASLGPDFPFGLFVCQDDQNTAPGTSGNQNFKLTRLEKIVPVTGAPDPPPLGLPPSTTTSTTISTTTTFSTTSTTRPPPGPVSVTFSPVADARVVKASPTRNFGADATLVADTSPATQSFLRFDVTGLGSGVTKARLQLWVTDKSNNGPEIYPTDPDWMEATITWNNRPTRTGPRAANLGKVASGHYVEWDVTSLVTGNGVFSFNVAGDSSDSTAFKSKEAPANRPQLVVDVAG